MTTASEDLLSPPSLSSPHSQLNGNGELNHSASMENISSIQDNIFMKKLGKPLKPSTRHPLRDDGTNKDYPLSDSNDNEEDFEYRPGSGFVQKLLGKFANKADTKRDSYGNSTLSKRYASLEDITGDSKAVKRQASKDDQKPSAVAAQFHRARSIESLDAPQSLRHADNRWDTDNTVKSPRSSHIDAPDVDLAREDIIIIEHTPRVPSLNLGDNHDSSGDSDQLKVYSYREEISQEELPKPNTVTNVRSLFETAATGSHVPRHHRVGSSSSDLPADKTQTPLSASQLSSPSQECSQSTSNEREPSKQESSSGRYPLKNNLESSKVSDGKSYTGSSSLSYSISQPPRGSSASISPRDGHDLSSSLPSSSAKTESTSLNQSSSSSDPKHITTVTERGSLFGVRSTSSPRSTASVKPTYQGKSPNSAVSVKPIPLQTPASAATSYRKSSPVVPVAPFKKTEPTEDDCSPRLIYQKPRSPTKKSPRPIFNHSTVISKESGNEKESGIKNNAKNSSDKDIEINSKVPSCETENHESSGVTKTENLSDANTEGKGQQRDISNNIYSTGSSVSVGEKTVIDIRGNNKKPNDTKPTPDFPKPPPRTKRIVSTKTRPAPTPPQPVESRKKSQPEERHGSMIYISSSDSNSEVDTTPPETPRNRSVAQEEKKPEDESEKAPPVKGIPSIIANRMKQNNKSPRDQSDSRQTKADTDTPDGIAVKLRKTEHDSPRPSENNLTSNRDSNPIEIQLSAMRRKNEANRAKASTGATQIFDSSQLAQKRKERKEAAAKAAAAAAASQGTSVPPLDLSTLNNNTRTFGAGRRKEIKPCNIVFVGENAPTSRNLLKKQRLKKSNIQFKEEIQEMYEYPSEDDALQAYLAAHPNEPEESDDVMFLDSFGLGGESSDDVDNEEEEEEDSNDGTSTPRGKEEEDGGESSFKSNPALSSTSTLQSYRGRFQEEFVFGSHRHEPEPPASVKQEPLDDPDSMMLRPAEEETVDTWSTNDSSDLLF